MSKKLFTEKEIRILSNNPYVRSVSSKGITYTDDFKQIFIAEDKKGKFPRAIFSEYGLEIDILGRQRIESATKRWRNAYRENGVYRLRDTRKDSSGRPRTKELSLEEKIARLEAQNNLLKAECTWQGVTYRYYLFILWEREKR